MGCETVIELDRPWEDPRFLTLLDPYEQELHALDSNYPTGQTLVYLDVENIHSYGAMDGDELVGFIVLEELEDKLVIHELYVTPTHRSGGVVRKLIQQVMRPGHTVVYDIFERNPRMRGYAAHFLKRRRIQATETDALVWNTACTRYEVVVPT